GAVEEAFAVHSRIIELEPKDPEGWISRGNAYREVHQYDKALADLSKAIELDPKYVMAWFYRGRAYSEVHQYDKALADLSVLCATRSGCLTAQKEAQGAKGAGVDEGRLAGHDDPY